MKNKTTWRSFSTPYKLLVSEEDYNLTETLIEFLTTELNKNIKTNWNTFQTNSHLSRGDYWNKTNKLLSSPAKKWPKEITQKAKYWRGVQEQLRCLALSQQERTKISKIAQKHNWNNTKTLREDLTANNLYPTNHEIRNICKAAALPTLPDNLEAVLDFTIQDKQTILQNGLSNEILIKNKWVKLEIPEPNYLRNSVIKYAKPKLWRQKDTKEIIVTIAYQISIKSLHRKAAAVLGVDLGEIKKFCAAAVNSKGYWTRELLPSRELESLAKKLKTIQDELKYCYSRKKRLTPYLVTEVSDSTLHSLYAVEDQIRLLKMKRTRIKDQLCWLAARDIVSHAVKQNCRIIHLEDLRFASEKKNLWDFSRLSDRVTQLAELVSIEVAHVDAAYTSQTDPFTRDFVGKKDHKREITLSDGSKMDGDHSAALEIAQRAPKRKSKNYATQHKIRSRGPRDSFERAKSVKRSSERKKSKIIKSGVRIIVVPPAQTKDSLESTCESTQTIQAHTKQFKPKQYE